MAEHQHTSIEEWRDISGYKGLYQVSNLGRVRSLDRVAIDARGSTYRRKGRMMKLSVQHGYVVISVCKGGVQKKLKVHQAVLTEFVGPRPKGMVACHWNDDGTDNRVENLRWAPQQENVFDAVRNGLHYQTKKTHCPRGHELAGDNLADGRLKMSKRICKACARAVTANRRDPSVNIQEIADMHYKKIMDGTDRLPMCRRGHLMDGENLIPSSMKRGERACLACHRARVRVRTNPSLDIQAVSDEWYEKLTGENQGRGTA